MDNESDVVLGFHIKRLAKREFYKHRWTDTTFDAKATRCVYNRRLDIVEEDVCPRHGCDAWEDVRQEAWVAFLDRREKLDAAPINIVMRSILNALLDGQRVGAGRNRKAQRLNFSDLPMEIEGEETDIFLLPSMENETRLEVTERRYTAETNDSFGVYQDHSRVRPEYDLRPDTWSPPRKSTNPWAGRFWRSTPDRFPTITGESVKRWSEALRIVNAPPSPPHAVKDYAIEKGPGYKVEVLENYLPPPPPEERSSLKIETVRIVPDTDWSSAVREKPKLLARLRRCTDRNWKAAVSYEIQINGPVALAIGKNYLKYFDKAALSPRTYIIIERNRILDKLKQKDRLFRTYEATIRILARDLAEAITEGDEHRKRYAAEALENAKIGFVENLSAINRGEPLPYPQA